MEIYTPMEKVLIEGVIEAQAKETDYLESAIQTKKDFTKCLELDLLLLEMEAKMDTMDGMTKEELLL